jgi:anti-sigma factor RsiW
MREQHLSDEAIAAFADDVLTGHARERARRHTASCAECNYAVVVQREAVWALRSAAAPSLPSGLLDRLREVPATTPIRRVPTTVDEHGTAMFATVAAPAAALVAPAKSQPTRTQPTKSQPATTQPGKSRRRIRPVAMTAASFAVVGALAGVGAVSDSAHVGDRVGDQVQIRPANVRMPAVTTGHAVTVAHEARALLPGQAW